MTAGVEPMPVDEDGVSGTEVDRLVERAGSIIVALLVSLFIASALALTLVEVDSFVAAPGTVEPAGLRTIRAPADGFLTHVLARSGQEVSPGEVLAVFDSTPIVRREREVRLRLAEQEVAHRRALQSRPLEMQAAREAERIAAARVARAVTLARRRLAEQGFPSEGDIDSLLALPRINVALEEAAADLRVARSEAQVARLQSERAAADSLALDATALSVARSRAELAAIAEDEARLVLRVPTGGMVFTDELEALPGRFVRQGEALMQIGSPGEWRVFLQVDERKVREVQPGQRVRLELASDDASSPTDRMGTVIAIAADPANAALAARPLVAVPTYRVEVEVDRAASMESLFKRGLSVRGRIVTGRQRLAMRLVERFRGPDA